MKRIVLGSALLVAFAAWAQQSFFMYLPFKNYSDAQNPFRYYVDNRVTNPAGIDVASVRSATEAAWGAWNIIPCATPKAQIVGYTSGAVAEPSNPYDMFNVTPVFVTTTSDTYYANAFSYDLSAVTLPLSYAGVLEQCDVYLNATPYQNGVPRKWTTAMPIPSDTLDVQSVMLHELGHCLGLDHTAYYPNSVMVASVLPGVTARVPTQDDADGLCARYPTSGALGAPCQADGGCAGMPGLKCVNQPMTSGPTARFCSKGCPSGQNFDCGLPLVCTPAPDFMPAFDGACLRPGSNVTQVGAPCLMSPDCGSSTGVCQMPAAAPSGATWWQGGYCTQDCSAGRPNCPSGSACIQFSNGAQVCMQSCRVGLADCRPGYTCAATTVGGVCVPRCFNNVDCAPGFQCRTCDGLCVAIQSQTQPGDICTDDDTCGFGQSCIKIDSNSATRICSSGCGSGCAQCPSGSTCHPIPSAGGQLFCLRNCVDQFSCPTGLQCAQLPTGRGCAPQCMFDVHCPVGLSCVAGQCANPMVDPDGGCGILCTTDDSGVPITPKKDAGHGVGGSGGCGCNASGAPLALALLAYMIARRNRPHGSIAPARRPRRL